MAANAAYWAIAAVAAYGARDQHMDAQAAQSAAENQANEQRAALAELQSEPEPVIPLNDDDAARRARRRSITSQMRRRGRASTILTGGTDTGSTLGA